MWGTTSIKLKGLMDLKQGIRITKKKLLKTGLHWFHINLLKYVKLFNRWFISDISNANYCILIRHLHHLLNQRHYREFPKAHSQDKCVCFYTLSWTTFTMLTLLLNTKSIGSGWILHSESDFNVHIVPHIIIALYMQLHHAIISIY